MNVAIMQEFTLGPAQKSSCLFQQRGGSSKEEEEDHLKIGVEDSLFGVLHEAVDAVQWHDLPPMHPAAKSIAIPEMMKMKKSSS
ncbi:hypothetical protein F2P79_010220 [Pimephales promelas]|nr:hypothetical protein F2P79_010220 [Pimephales promelas]